MSAESSHLQNEAAGCRALSKHDRSPGVQRHHGSLAHIRGRALHVQQAHGAAKTGQSAICCHSQV